MRLLFAGDFIHTGKTKINIDRSIIRLIGEADYSICNLEGPIANDLVLNDNTEKRGPKLHNEKGIEQELKNLGFNCVSLANNHIMDYGSKGLEYTIKCLQEASINYLGAGLNEKDVYRYISLGDEISILSVAEKQFWPSDKEDEPGFAWMLNANVFRKIKQAKEKTRHVILMCHCGGEGINIPLPQVRELYRQFIDFGADIVIGTHPHLIQGVETYCNKKIYYSLGNFWTCYDLNKNVNSIIVVIDASRDGIIESTYELEGIGSRVSLKHSSVEFDEATRLLDGRYADEYIARIDDYCVEYYEQLKIYYGSIIGFDFENKANQNKFAEYRRMGYPIQFDDLLVWHNCLIETNRWIAERAIRRHNQEKQRIKR